MLTGPLKSQIDAIWDVFWSGGISNPMDVIEQMTASTVRRRYHAGLANFFRLYTPLSSNWRFYDASGAEPRVIAIQVKPGPVQVYDKQTWGRASAQNQP